jgi:membrane protein implicated in regulation of membrane protease activity
MELAAAGRNLLLMYLIAIAWVYVVVMMALAEALSPHGTVLGAAFTLLLYGALPLSIVLYILNTPHRRRARAARDKAEAPADASVGTPSAAAPDDRRHAAGDAVAPEREEP